MMSKALRKIVRIDEQKCNGCGLCVPACAEGALQIIDGKAKLVSDNYCDGLGACLGECPQGAITIEEREAEEFDEGVARQHPDSEKGAGEEAACGGCPSAAVRQIAHQEVRDVFPMGQSRQQSMLCHWPVQLSLVPPSAAFLNDARVILVGDCVPFAYADFHRGLLRDHALLVACPKLDDFSAHLIKLTDILSHSKVKSIDVVRMEVPCCGGLTQMVKQAMQLSGRNIPLQETVIGINGEIK
ncbi:MAG: 4Fe-4S binding protein [Dehalococcoidales bacterium]|nr:4Fe-4S binding protein [Dehalococcoidales bacterium]